MGSAALAASGGPESLLQQQPPRCPSPPAAAAAAPAANGATPGQEPAAASTSYRDRSDLPDLASYRLRHNLAGHSRAVSSVAFSPDGQLLASASSDGTAILWRTDTGARVHQLRGHSTGLSDVAWSRDGRMLATASDDQTLRLWDAGSGQCLRVLRGHTHFVSSCSFNAAGNLLASGSFDETIRVWDVHSGRCIKLIPGHSDPVTSVHFNNELDNPLIASASFDGISRIWHATSGCCLRSLVDERDPTLSFARFTPNSRYILTASLGPDASGLFLWDFDHKVVKKSYEGHTNTRFMLQATFVVNDPDNRRLVVSGSEDHHVYAWDLQSRHIMGLLRGRESVGAAGEGHTGVVLSVDATAAGEGIPPLIASGGRDQVVKVWEHVGAPAANQAA